MDKIHENKELPEELISKSTGSLLIVGKLDFITKNSANKYNYSQPRAGILRLLESIYFEGMGGYGQAIADLEKSTELSTMKFANKCY